MKSPILAIVLNLLLGGLCIADSLEPIEASPFQSVILDGNVIVATLPKDPKMLVRIGDGAARQCKESEVFRLASGEAMHITATRHTIYSIVSQLQPKPGLQIEYIFDGRSFRRGIVTKKFFVPAKTAKRLAEQDGTEQPATRSESKSEGSAKPEPESEGRSR